MVFLNIYRVLEDINFCRFFITTSSVEPGTREPSPNFYSPQRSCTQVLMSKAKKGGNKDIEKNREVLALVQLQFKDNPWREKKQSYLKYDPPREADNLNLVSLLMWISATLVQHTLLNRTYFHAKMKMKSKSKLNYSAPPSVGSNNLG